MAMAMVRDGINTGYPIKQMLEQVASFFWSASYGQIYPELRRLEAAGLLAGREVTVERPAAARVLAHRGRARSGFGAGWPSRPSRRSGFATRGSCG